MINKSSSISQDISENQKFSFTYKRRKAVAAVLDSPERERAGRPTKLTSRDRWWGTGWADEGW